MSFTDEQLKVFRERHARLTHTPDWAGQCQICNVLERLGSAEVVCKLCDDHEFNPCPGVTEALRAWRKAAGK
jgi:hypothetical protein